LFREAGGGTAPAAGRTTRGKLCGFPLR
jgi:hypothetical protein